MVENSAPTEQVAAVVVPPEDVQHEEIHRLVYGANKEDCYLDRLNDSLDDLHKFLLEMRTNAMNGCLLW